MVSFARSFLHNNLNTSLFFGLIFLLSIFNLKFFLPDISEINFINSLIEISKHRV